MVIDSILFLTGVIVGILNAVAGGGSLVAFPMLLWTGLPALAATGTNFVATLPGQVMSSLGYRKHLKKVPKIYILLLVPCVIGGLIGSYLLRHTSIHNFEAIVPFLVFAAVIIFALEPIVHARLKQRAHHKKSKNAPGLVLIGITLSAITIYGGYFGAGLGFAVLALASFTSVRDIFALNGMKNVVGAVVLVTAVIGIHNSGIINWHDGLVMAAGSLVGGYSGSRLAQKVPAVIIRVVVVIIGLGTAGYLLVHYH